MALLQFYQFYGCGMAFGIVWNGADNFGWQTHLMGGRHLLDELDDLAVRPMSRSRQPLTNGVFCNS